MTFEELNLIEPIKKALKIEGYITPTPIQEKAILPILAGKDFLGCAQTGTGKTAAFAIPVLQNLVTNKKKENGHRPIRALILAPTRELAIQIGESFNAYSKFLNVKSVVIFGGVSQKPQTDALKRGAEVVIATPGRLLDLVNQNYVKLDQVKFLVLDEADRMLDMGFINDIKKVISELPRDRQTILFSATMPTEIDKLVNSILKNPEKVAVAPVSSTVDKIEQQLYYVAKKNKKSLLVHLLENKTIATALIFSRTKHGANKIVKDLHSVNIIAEAIHGDKSQNARQLALSNFKAGKTRVLVATDIAARGIDVNELSHVINYDLPNEPETYVHRIGRTGRAGLEGIAISFCDEEAKSHLKDIQTLIAKSIPVIEDHPFLMNGQDLIAMDNFSKKKTVKSNFVPKKDTHSAKEKNKARKSKTYYDKKAPKTK